VSARTGGQPLWLVRPILDGVIREDLAQFAVGTLDAVMEQANELHAATGNQYAVTLAARKEAGL
jgi:hypothetical protein